MPQFTADNILVVTYDELVPKFYGSKDSLKSTVYRCEKRGFGLKRIKRGRYGSQSLIEFDSLPSIIKEQLDDPRKAGHILDMFFEIDPEALRFYQDYRFWDGSSIDDEKQVLYVTNASVIKAVIRLRDSRTAEIMTKRGKLTKLWNSLLNDVNSFASILDKKYDLQFSLPDNVRRFKEKVMRFEQDGYEYLISKKHLNTNGKKVDDDTLKLFESLFARQTYKPTYTEVADTYEGFLNGYVEVINNETGELYDPQAFPKLSKSTVYNYLSEWKSAIATNTLRSGDRQKLMSRFKIYHSMEKPKFAGSLISIDDRQPPFYYDKNKNRLWLYMGIDVASECYTTWVYGKSKEGIILDFYRQMVRNYAEWGFNLPAELEAESSLNSSFKNTFLKEGNMFQYVHIEANVARAKIIERYNGMMRYGVEKKREGWVSRPFARSESNESGAKAPEVLTYDRIVREVLKEIMDWNNSEHSQIPGKTRWEVFCERQHPDLQKTNYRGLIPSLGYKTKTSCNVGQVRLQGNDYLLGDNGKIATGSELISLMTMAEGENIDVYWLDDNDGKVLKAYAYIGSKYICELISKPTYQRAKIERTPEDIDKRGLMSAYVMTVEGYVKRKKNSIDKITVIDNRDNTLNNKFVIRDIDDMIVKAAKRARQPAEVVEDYNDDMSYADDSFNTDLKDRF